MRGTLLCPGGWTLHERELYCVLEGGLYMRETLLCPVGWILHERDSIVP